MVAIVGGLKRGEREYLEILKSYKLKGKVYNTQCPDFCKKIKNCEMCIIFTNLVSHNLLNSCNKVCKTQNIPIIHLNNNGISKLKENLEKNYK
ncbi:MAG: DUF2325 domain-containing protein [Cetobacterium sp.]|uniref:DUF2325 domain-containing protein n=1 Tax=Cetobacterium sp. TaxID=2071632 RepID=UPI003F2F2FD9